MSDSRSVKAELVPLNGKYYETKITVDYHGHPVYVSVCGGSSQPSKRELDAEGVSREHWEKNKEDCGIDIWGGHFESFEAHQVAKLIVLAINLTARIGDE